MFFYDARLFTKITWQKYAVNTCRIEVEEMPININPLINNNDKKSICYSQNFKSNCASQIPIVATAFVSIYITTILAQTMRQAIFKMVVQIVQ